MYKCPKCLFETDNPQKYCGNCSAEILYGNPEQLQHNKKKTTVSFRPYRWWLTMILFVSIEPVYQLGTGTTKNVPLLSVLFTGLLLFCAFTSIRQSVAKKVFEALGIYLVWVLMPVFIAIASIKAGVNSTPIAIVLISLAQCPALWLAMRRSTYFIETR